MKIGIVGVGGVGGYFGGKLAMAGEDVRFLARGAHLAALKKDGLTLLSDLSPVEGLKISATDRADEIGPSDIVLLAVKLWDTEAAIAQMAPMVGPDTKVVSFQNGIAALDLLIGAFGPERVWGGVSHIFAQIERPGAIRQKGALARLTFGELDGAETAPLRAFDAACTKAGIDHAVSKDIRRAIWEKFIFLAAFSGVTSLTRSTIGPIRSDPDCRKLLAAAVTETSAIARKKGIAIPEDQVAKTLGFFDGLPPEMKSSMAGDLERGYRLELPWLSGAVARLGEELGIPTPAHAAILAGLKFFAEGKKA